METFADYMLAEENYIKKIEIAYYLSKRERLFFDKSVIFKTELARMFIDTMKLNVDRNLVITACLLYACRKSTNPSDLSKIKSYAKDGAEYLELLGFDEKFCTICEQANRYTNVEPRTSEGDILELVDQLGGMMVDREERRGFPLDEAIVLLEHRNLKNYNNIYLEKFKEFINKFCSLSPSLTVNKIRLSFLSSAVYCD